MVNEHNRILSRMYFYLVWLFFTAQFGISYHCIFNVEWMGWDLVEPVTYSVS